MSKQMGIHMIRRIIGILLFLSGVALVAISMYINEQVAAGKLKIADAQQQVDQAQSLFSQNALTKPVGKGLTNSAQQKINAGEGEVSYYADIASHFKIAGIVLIVLGICVILIGSYKKKKK